MADTQSSQVKDKLLKLVSCVHVYVHVYQRHIINSHSLIHNLLRNDLSKKHCFDKLSFINSLRSSYTLNGSQDYFLFHISHITMIRTIRGRNHSACRHNHARNSNIIFLNKLYLFCFFFLTLDIK